ncbi:MAG: plastocyanin/azurin family copper-binding protein, partial [Ignavibacteria bacterium]|nr:plastocyanin/azurin family copper-binding protein [Ignavibacteria bacterium]
VYMYHCAPGGHAIPMHVIFGQYGMMVVKPKKKYKLETILNKPPDVEIYLNQHEFYTNGKDAIEGKPLYTVFNGKIFRYVEEPIKAKPGDYVRIYFLNIGPNLLSTFHLVGIIWDYAYWQGHPDNIFIGGQSVTAGPTDSWVVEFRVPPDEGAYLMLSHAVGSTDRGAIGLLVCDDSAATPVTVLGDGPVRTPEELASLKSKVTRIISPFEPGSRDVDPVEIYGPETEEVLVKIIGNSYYPKSIQIAKGTKVRWVNEDVFTYMEGEFAGIHNVVSYEGGPQAFSSNLLGHGESFEFIFEDEGEYKYMCTPHPYMKGTVKVTGASGRSSYGTSVLGMGFLSAILVFVVLMLGVMIYDRKKRR